MSDETTVGRLNKLSIAYFTNPHINWPENKAQNNFWNDFLAQKLPYHRGFLYFWRLNSRILQYSNGTKSLDGAASEFALFRGRNLRHDSARWLELLESKFLPPGEASREYRSIMEGELARPVDGAHLNMGFKMKRTACEKFELGFDVRSLNTRTVTGLDENSFAAQAGLRDEDLILKAHNLDNALEIISQNLTLTIWRDNRESNITFWPRSAKVKCYLWSM